MREVSKNVSGSFGLNYENRIDQNDSRIVEKVWICDIYGEGESYSGCYIKKWYNFKPKLYLMVEDNEVIIKNKK